MFRRLRILFLLIVLAFVALATWLSGVRLSSWDDTAHWIAVYPIDAEGTEKVGTYMRELEASDFEEIERWMADWAARYDPSIDRPIEIKLAPPVETVPPEPPAGGNPITTALWSLQMRWWAWRLETYDGPADVQIFVAYHDPETHDRLKHSYGLRKGAIGVVNAYGERGFGWRNNVVIAHEFLHIAGATDKYDRSTGRPVHPAGFADPDRDPLYPQQRAEIMGGKIPVGPDELEMPRSLDAVVVGRDTAAEIGWIDD